MKTKSENTLREDSTDEWLEFSWWGACLLCKEFEKRAHCIDSVWAFQDTVIKVLLPVKIFKILSLRESILSCHLSNEQLIRVGFLSGEGLRQLFL